MHTCDAMKPAPPVTKMFFGTYSPSNRASCPAASAALTCAKAAIFPLGSLCA